MRIRTQHFGGIERAVIADPWTKRIGVRWARFHDRYGTAAERIVAFYNRRGTAERRTKEGKGAIEWIRVSAVLTGSTVCCVRHAPAYHCPSRAEGRSWASLTPGIRGFGKIMKCHKIDENAVGSSTCGSPTGASRR